MVSETIIWNVEEKFQGKSIFLCPKYQTTVASSSVVLNLFHFSGFSLNKKTLRVGLLPYTEKISLAWWNDLRQHCKTTIYTWCFLEKCPREMRSSRSWARQTFAVLAMNSRETQTASTHWYYVIPCGDVTYLLPSFVENRYFYTIHSDVVLLPMPPPQFLHSILPLLCLSLENK